ncbi:hypothetical protein SSP35_03_01960 [Streptomyces sp. NBRC 110611]|uniref:DUF4097 family beta strand repeat-containing protein n=1 Tax=Streptomyces sp. NBRC 110611 TaxID=1621259 RepID=UPI00082D3964|nr:DUF4097 family beta strand repeat-containing protein [Streptomyces sp. NBRC 110611]GAU66548.1 hypothetical protein SSP35_03_01960 [Streptomyces sp. NBRC 110611]
MNKRACMLGTVALACVGAWGLSGCGLLPGKTFTDDATVSKKITAIRIDGDSGSVTVRGTKSGSPDGTKSGGSGGGTASVHRAVTYHGDRPEGATHRVEGGVLVLGDCGEECSVSYTVEVPAGLPVSGETSNGSVNLTRVGAVDVTTSSGAIELDDVSGAVDVRTSNGRIAGRGLSGTHLTAETSNGDIDLTPATPQNVRAKTSNGGITVKMPKGHYRIAARSSNGSRDITVPDDPAARYRLDLTTSNGSITAKSA